MPSILTLNFVPYHDSPGLAHLDETILVMVSGAFLGSGLMLLSCLNMSRGMRIVGSSSAAISAACDPELTGTKQAEDGWVTVKGPVVWRDVTVATDFKPDIEDDGGGHCCFVGAAGTDWHTKLCQPVERISYN